MRRPGDVPARELGQHRRDGVAVDGEARAALGDVHVVRARDAGGGRGIRRLERDLGAGQVPQLGERAGLDDPARRG